MSVISSLCISSHRESGGSPAMFLVHHYKPKTVTYVYLDLINEKKVTDNY